MEERFEYYWRVYTLAFQLGLTLAVRCEGFRHIIAISAPGCNITYSPFIWLDDRGQATIFCSCRAPNLREHLSDVATLHQIVKRRKADRMP